MSNPITASGPQWTQMNSGRSGVSGVCLNSQTQGVAKCSSYPGSGTQGSTCSFTKLNLPPALLTCLTCPGTLFGTTVLPHLSKMCMTFSSLPNRKSDLCCNPRLHSSKTSLAFSFLLGAQSSDAASLSPLTLLRQVGQT